MEITVIRHAETIDNQLGVYQGQPQGRLSSLGIEQATQACRDLSNECFDIIFTSDLQRAVETSSIIFAHSKTNIIKDKRLRERFLGPLQGEKISKEINYNGHIDGAESVEDMFERVRSFLAQIKAKCHNKRVAMVSHGITIKVIISICEQKDITETEVPVNCAILRFNI